LSSLQGNANGTIGTIANSILDPLAPKSYAIKLAVDAAVSVLRVDSIIVAKQVRSTSPTPAFSHASLFDVPLERVAISSTVSFRLADSSLFSLLPFGYRLVSPHRSRTPTGTRTSWRAERKRKFEETTRTRRKEGRDENGAIGDRQLLE